MMGCDPEFFFSQNNKIIGSEKILPAKGLATSGSKITRDGIQAELNPTPHTCRKLLANEIRWCFKTITKQIPKNTQINLSQNIKVTKSEMNSLSEESKQFGCKPSTNIYKTESSINLIDASKFYSRSAGGHLHLGIPSQSTNLNLLKALNSPKHTVPFLDLIVGNTCVLIDRDKSNITRRKLYGQAGEYRQLENRIEYRTLSNFWLKNYTLMSFVTGLARMAVSIAAESYKHPKIKKTLFSQINTKDIIEAINKNNTKLAMKNFNAIKNTLSEIMEENSHTTPLNKETIPLFLFFAKKGINYWFTENPTTHWTQLNTQINNGWESFLLTTVQQEYARK